MLKHVECEMSKQEIIETIVLAFDKAHEEAEKNPTDRNILREEGIRDILKLIPIYEYN